MKNRRAKKPHQSFKEAVEATGEVKNCYMAGLNALSKSHKNKINLGNPDKCGGSLFIDLCLSNQGKYLNDNRWDYAFDYKGEVFFIEVHPAKSNEVETVIKKFEWLRNWLTSKAPGLNTLKAKSRFPYYWIQTSAFDIPKHSSQYRRISQLNLKPIPALSLEYTRP